MTAAFRPGFRPDFQTTPFRRSSEKQKVSDPRFAVFLCPEETSNNSPQKVNRSAEVGDSSAGPGPGGVNLGLFGRDIAMIP